MAEGTARASRLPAAAALARRRSPSFVVRFHAFLSGGTLYRRDAGFFFVPWRSAPRPAPPRGGASRSGTTGCRTAARSPPTRTRRSSGRLSPLVVVLGPTGLALVNVALLLALFFWRAAPGRLAAAGGGRGDARPPLLGRLPVAPGLFGVRGAAAPLRSRLPSGRVWFWRRPRGARAAPRRPSRRSPSVCRRSAASPRSR